MKTPLLLMIILCFSLSSCVQDTHSKTVTFKVKTDSTMVFQNIGIRGNLKPLSWDKTSFLNGPDQDGIYSTTVVFDTANDQLSFKFVINDSLFELEGQDNRTLRFEYKPETLEYLGEFDKAKQ